MNNLLDIQGLEVKFQKFNLGPIDLSVPKGRVVAYIGPNGAGKTTTIKSVYGAYKIFAGEVLFEGLNISADQKDRSWINRIGIVSDESIYWRNLKVEDYFKFLSKMFDCWNVELMNSLAKRLKIDVKKVVGSLSAGDSTKVSIIAALSHNPTLLLLDEPTNGLDPFSRNMLIDILFEFMQNENNAILYSSHIIPEIDKIADEIAILIGGEIYSKSSKAEMIENWRTFTLNKFNGAPEEVSAFEVISSGGQYEIISNDFVATREKLKNSGYTILEENFMPLENIIFSIFKKLNYD